MTAIVTPFVAALGAQLDRASPAVRRHLARTDGVVVHRGVLSRLWKRGIPGRIAARVLHLEGEVGGPFELRNEIVAGPSGGVSMLWHRTHRPGRGLGSIRFDAARQRLVDSIGCDGRLEVELAPSVEDHAVLLRSGRQWIRLLGLRVPLPRPLFGGADTREWEEPDGSLGLSLTLRHPWFGAIAGYEARMRETRSR